MPAPILRFYPKTSDHDFACMRLSLSLSLIVGQTVQPHGVVSVNYSGISH
jgi:hypothetical protein